MAVIRLQLLSFNTYNTLYQKLNIPFADDRSMQYFVEKTKTESTCKQTNTMKKISFFVEMVHVIQPLLRKDNKII